MGYTNFENGKNGKTPVNDTNLNKMQRDLVEMIFPVGSIYPTQSNTNPSTILGFGTWERLKGKVCVGLDEDDEDGYFDEIGKTGGEKKHKQTIDELVEHNHDMNHNNVAAMAGSGSHEVNQGSGSRTYEQIGTDNAGGGQPFNVVQPYEVVGYMWIRRA